jgi:hypothetical protein
VSAAAFLFIDQSFHFEIVIRPRHLQRLCRRQINSDVELYAFLEYQKAPVIIIII